MLLDLDQADTHTWDEVAEAIEGGAVIGLGALPTGPNRPSGLSSRQVADRALAPLRALGLGPDTTDRLLLTPACGLAGVPSGEAVRALRDRSRGRRDRHRGARPLSQYDPPARQVGKNGGVQLRHLRILSTLLLAFAVAQAGLGSGYLDGFDRLLIAHATNAFAVFVLTVLSAVFGFSLPA